MAIFPHHNKRLKEELYNATGGANNYIKVIEMFLETEQITNGQFDKLKEVITMSMNDSLNSSFDVPELKVYWQAIDDILKA